MLRRASTAALLALFAVIGAAIPASAAGEGWNHKTNITDAAKRLVVLHKREGSTGVLKFLEACYKTHLLSSKFTAGLESCLAQDLMHAQVLAVVYSRLPPARIKEMGAPTPEVIAKSMNTRVTSSFMQYKVTVTEAEEFKRLVNDHGMPIFMAGIFPKSAGPKNGAAKPGN